MSLLMALHRQNRAAAIQLNLNILIKFIAFSSNFIFFSSHLIFCLESLKPFPLQIIDYIHIFILLSSSRPPKYVPLKHLASNRHTATSALVRKFKRRQNASLLNFSELCLFDTQCVSLYFKRFKYSILNKVFFFTFEKTSCSSLDIFYNYLDCVRAFEFISYKSQ